MARTPTRRRPCEIPDGTPLDQCLHADALGSIRALPDRCIDIVVTDPPWGTTRLRLDKGGRPSPDVWSELKRVCRPNAWLLVFGHLRMFADILQAGWQEQYSYIWHKPHGSLNLAPDARPTLTHETIECFHLGRPGGGGRRYYDGEALRTWGHSNYMHRGRMSYVSTWHKEHGISSKHPSASSDGGRHATTVIQGHLPKACMAKRERTAHPTQKPTSLLRYLIRGHCPPGGVVLDPYAGSASTLLAARAVGRRFIGIELDDRWHRLAMSRLASVQDYASIADAQAARAESRKVCERRAAIAAVAASSPPEDAPAASVQTLLAPAATHPPPA